MDSCARSITRVGVKAEKPPLKVDISKKLRKIMDSALPMPYAVIVDFILTDVIPGEFAVSPEPENGNKPFTFKTTGVVTEILLDEENLMRLNLVEDECKDTLNVLAVNPSHRFAVGQHVQCFGYIGPASVGKYALLLAAAEDQGPGPGQPDFIVCHPFKLKKPPGAGKKGRNSRNELTQAFLLTLAAHCVSVLVTNHNDLDTGFLQTTFNVDLNRANLKVQPRRDMSSNITYKLTYLAGYSNPAGECYDCYYGKVPWRSDVVATANTSVLRVGVFPMARCLSSSFVSQLEPVCVVHLSQCCPNLLCVETGSIDVDDEAICALARNCPHLKEVAVLSGTSLTDASVSVIANMCQNISKLSFSGCALLTNVSLIAIAKGCPRLTSLRTNNCTGLTDAGYIAIAQHCPHLLSIALSCRATDATIFHLALHSSSLICVWCHSSSCFSDAALVALVKGCKELALVDMKGCRGLTAEGVAIAQSLNADIRIYN